MTTFVLGWDGLDARLLEEYGMQGSFAPHGRPMESLDNPVLGKPDTYEIWPSIITGEPPEVHGVRLIDDDVGARFDSPFLRYGANLVHRFLPTDTRIWIGLKLRNMGFSLSQKTPDWYSERDVSTVFDGRRSRVITVPNYVTEEDGDVGLDIGWNGKHAEMLYADADVDEERVVYEPKKRPERVDEWLMAESSEKIGAVLSAADRDHDLVFAWLPYLDTVGHTVPAVDDPDWQRRAYRKAATLTDAVHGALDEDDTLVVVSDHGNRDARHTGDAYIASTDPEVVEDVESVLDVRAAIESTFEEPETAEAEAVEASGGARASVDVGAEAEPAPAESTEAVEPEKAEADDD